MDLAFIALRILHIGSGILWVGGAVLVFRFIEPTVEELGATGQTFMNSLVEKRKLPIYFMIVSTLTVFAGLILYWRASNGLNPSWITSPTGLAFTTGGLSAVVAWILGNLGIKATIDKLTRLSTEAQAGGGPPSAELMAQIHAAVATLKRIGLIDLILLTIAVLAMESARYL
ncbi:MAG TPA: hypothetical protein VM427_10380 [Patescibacteria group bacterium]|nr:hypothetical protein [Patescibacteria group bacterium]